MELTITFERHDNLDNFDLIFEQAATSELIPLCEQGTGIAQEKSPIDRGFYRGSLTNEVAPVSPGIIQGRIFSTADPIVTQVIETGRAPGRFPPVDLIRAWVQRKLGVTPKMLANVAYLVGRKIAMFGIPGRHVFRDTFQQMQPSIQEAKERITEKIAQAI